MLSELMLKKNLPSLMSRKEMLDILAAEEYGVMPPAPDELSFSVQEDIIPNFCGGKAICSRITANCEIYGKRFSFPFYSTTHTDGKKHPFFVHINFRSDIPDKHQPTEELIDNGFNILSFCHNDVTRDNDDFTDGLAGVLYENGERLPHSAGKIAMWAWAAQRVMDYAEMHAEMFDLDCAVVCGHSRLGKTALLCGAVDERFNFVYSNDSGCSGAAITRGKRGETVADICDSFSYWFCESYRKYIRAEEKMPFDQHFLVASISPRKVMIGSAHEDIWADPLCEQLCCFAASPAFKNGFVCPDRVADVGEVFLDGDIGYHLRHGKHFFSREDWNRLILFIKHHYRIR